MVVHLDPADIAGFVKIFSVAEFYCPPEEVLQIEARRIPYGHFNLIHHKTGFKADIYLQGQDPLQRWGLAHKKRVVMSDSMSLWLAPPEYVIVRKLEYFREGGSDKHLRDIRSMLPQIEKDLDREFLMHEITHRQLGSHWAQVLNFPPTN